MKTKILVIVIIICSTVSWIIWAFLLDYIKNQNKNEQKNTLSINNTFTQIQNLENNVTKIVKKISPSVVSIIIKKDLIIYKSDPWWFFKEPVWSVEKKIWWWTGFFIKKDWTIITNKHVISDKNATYTVITNNWREYDWKVLALDPSNDLAIIKIESKENEEFTPLKIVENKSNIKLWQFAIAIWNALAEFQNSISLWVISGKDRIIEVWKDRITWLIQTDAAINPWNSWWPLIDINWNVIWINTAIIDWSEWIWFAILLTKQKIEYIISSIEKNWKIWKPFIWVSYLNINENLKNSLKIDSEYWAYISLVAPWSNAEKAGIKSWDVILEIDSRKIKSNASIDYTIQNKIPWEKIKLKIIRGSWKIEEIEVELWEI